MYYQQGSEIAVHNDAAGTPVEGIDGSTGSFPVGPSTATGRDTRRRGLLRHVRGSLARLGGLGAPLRSFRYTIEAEEAVAARLRAAIERREPQK